MSFYRIIEKKINEIKLTTYQTYAPICSTQKIIDEVIFQTIIKSDNSEFAYPWSLETWNKVSNEDDFVLFTAQRNLDLIGFLLIRISREEKLVHLMKFLVMKIFRRDGVGQQLFNELLAYSLDNNLEKLYLEVEEDNEVAIGLYLSNHFKKLCLTKNFYSDGRNAWKMMRKYNI